MYVYLNYLIVPYRDPENTSLQRKSIYLALKIHHYVHLHVYINSPTYAVPKDM